MVKSLKLSLPEVLFFGIVFILFSILTDFEYNLYEKTGRLPSLLSLLERLIYGVLRTIPYWLYYKLILPALFEKRYRTFGWRLLVFLFLLDGYLHYVMYGLVMNLWFLPETMLVSARKWYHSNVLLHFSIVYIIRELLMVSALGYYQQSVRQQQRLHELSQHQLQTELDSLRAQLQPHFFFNTLNTIYSLALHGSVKTASLVARHADIMRYILYRARKKRVPLDEEINFLSNYVAVESMRFSDKASIRFETQGIHNRIFIEPLLLLPFVENTFKHGLSQEIRTGFVQIVLVLIDHELILETRNSMVQAAGHTRADPGIGLANVSKQLALLYPDQHELSIQPDNTCYFLRLRLLLSSND
ncbi:sensor histidine kinase [Arsenicibacter rosenii]|uniref:Signal transduction histidine kinase internal region domain-containing protein n=1 Tax=Arsenicibacter rosenii TaxID=1750698 RepID=A0A1S2VM82_9BACT|nr:histidine kinase [Arsenicibacter rosenii]OIN59887.1 hypothetical protein BLX24_08550 [Arsenicibacter rosenii]